MASRSGFARLAMRCALLAAMLGSPGAALPAGAPAGEPSGAATAPPSAGEGEGAPGGGPRWWALAGQATAVGFLVPGFHSPYLDPEMSFGGPEATQGWSFVVSLFAGARPWEGAALVVQPEYANGHGAPNVSGLSGYLDGNIIRVAKVGTAPYLARLFLHQDLALGGAGEGDPEEAENPEAGLMPTGPSAFGPRPASRLEITAGKIALTDFFDSASGSDDPRHRFMNWALMTNGAWDFAADTRGYTWGLVLALEQPRWALRAGVAMMPTTANGPIFDGDLRHARSEVVEGEWRYQLLGNPGAVKLLWYWNHARMGRYADALAAAPPGQAPDITSVRTAGALKYGAGLLVDQRLGPAWTFLRASWNDGRTETFVFTEIDRAVSAGAEVFGGGWGRPGDHLGIGVAAGGLAPDHARYLAAGGRGFQLGDGRLAYAWEVVGEAWYGFRASRLVEIALDVQGIVNPGMNSDRGPALALGARVHLHL